MPLNREGRDTRHASQGVKWGHCLSEGDEVKNDTFSQIFFKNSHCQEGAPAACCQGHEGMSLSCPGHGHCLPGHGSQPFSPAYHAVCSALTALEAEGRDD